jgi:hypothetical protein
VVLVECGVSYFIVMADMYCGASGMWCVVLYCDGRDVLSLVQTVDTGKGKAIPLQAWTGPQGSRRLRLPDSKTIST